jgi:sugar/nucleoside kinase (ribokinase family)
MNFIVIGEPCVDVVKKANGDTFNSYGGILYSVISLSVLAGKNDKIIPVMNIGDDEFENITEILSKYPNISLEGIQKVNHPTRRVYLDYNLYNTDRKARFEYSTNPTYAITFDFIKQFLGSTDAILVNMVSGVDISLETFSRIREEFKGFIHIDIHNLVMKTNPDGTREHTTLPDWLAWCTNADTVQMNEFEIAVLSSEKRKEYQVAEDILVSSGKNVVGLIVTRGVSGVSGYTQKEKSFGNEKFTDIDKQDISAIENPRFLDSTGCGDVFASAFTFDYANNKDFMKSIHYANRMASYKTSLEGIDQLHKLK